MRLPDLTSGPVAFDEAVTPWRAWTPRQAADALTAAAPAARWAVAGGWAIDLHIGHPTRDHDDLEISVLAADIPQCSRRSPNRRGNYRREKDEADLRSVLPVLDDDRRAWLAGALDRVHPDHPWREHLGPPV